MKIKIKLIFIILTFQSHFQLGRAQQDTTSFDVENHGNFLYKCFENVSQNSVEIEGVLQTQYSSLNLDYFVKKFNKTLPYHFNLVKRKDESSCRDGEFELTIPTKDDGASVFFSFTPAGLLVYAKEEPGAKPEEIYFHPENFCVSKITPEFIGVRACKSSCHIDKPEVEKGSSICLPKCCPINMVMAGYHCVPKPIETEWKIPNIYDNLRSKMLEKIQPQFQYNYVNYHWNCSTETHTDAKLVLKSKEVRILKDGRVFQKHPQKGWVLLYKGKGSRLFCMDNYIEKRNESNPETFSERLLLLTCQDKFDKSYVYPQIVFCITLVATLIHMVTCTVYILLWDSQNVHGWTAFVLAACQVFLNFFLCVLFGIFGFSDPEKILTGQLHPLCIGIGIFHHFMLICTFSWSTVFSFDAWSKIRSMTLTGGSKGKRRFLFYSGFGFGLPILIVMIAILIEFNIGNGEESTGIVRPGYGQTCVILESLAYLFYVTLVIGTLFGVNMFFAIHTLKGVFDAKKGVQMFKDSKSSAVDNQSQLVIKLFVLMGIFLLFEIILAFASPAGISIYFTVLDFYRIFHAIGLFWIFIWNKKTATQLILKFPKLVKFFPSLGPTKVVSAVVSAVTLETPT